MPAFLYPGSVDPVISGMLRVDRMTDRADLVEHFDAGLFKHVNKFRSGTLVNGAS